MLVIEMEGGRFDTDDWREWGRLEDDGIGEEMVGIDTADSGREGGAIFGISKHRQQYIAPAFEPMLATTSATDAKRLTRLFPPSVAAVHSGATMLPTMRIKDLRATHRAITMGKATEKSVRDRIARFHAAL